MGWLQKRTISKALHQQQKADLFFKYTKMHLPTFLFPTPIFATCRGRRTNVRYADRRLPESKNLKERICVRTYILVSEVYLKSASSITACLQFCLYCICLSRDSSFCYYSCCNNCPDPRLLLAHDDSFGIWSGKSVRK